MVILRWYLDALWGQWSHLRDDLQPKRQQNREIQEGKEMGNWETTKLVMMSEYLIILTEKVDLTAHIPLSASPTGFFALWDLHEIINAHDWRRHAIIQRSREFYSLDSQRAASLFNLTTLRPHNECFFCLDIYFIICLSIIWVDSLINLKHADKGLLALAFSVPAPVVVGGFEETLLVL